MTPRKLHQQALYLEQTDADTLDQLATETQKQKQTLLREAVTDLFVKYRAQGFLQPNPNEVALLKRDDMLQILAREIRAGASIDINALVASGELMPKERGWYVMRGPDVLKKLARRAEELENRTLRNGKIEMRVKLSSGKKWQELVDLLPKDG